MLPRNVAASAASLTPLLMGCTSARSRWRQEPAMLGLLPVTALGLAAAPPAAAVPAAGQLVSAAATSESRPCRDLLAKGLSPFLPCEGFPAG